MKVVVQQHDPQWSAAFAQERAVLESVLAPWLSGGIHHIGSTSIPGLAAKPILDMLAGVADLGIAEAAVSPLQELGYVHAPHRPRALWFFKPDQHGDQTHALHLTEPGSDLWQERLAFRDALRAQPSLRDEYEQLKVRLALEHPDDLAAYTRNKREFVARVLRAEGISLRGPHRQG